MGSARQGRKREVGRGECMVGTHTKHGTQPCNTCIPKAKHRLDMGPNLTILAFQTKTHTELGTQQNAIFTFQIKTHTGLGTQQNAIFTFQTKTHTRPRTQPCNTYIPKLKHTLDLRPNLVIPTFQN